MFERGKVIILKSVPVGLRSSLSTISSNGSRKNETSKVLIRETVA